MSEDIASNKKIYETQDRANDGTFVKTQIHTKETAADPDIDEPLVSVNINNPFHKLLHWIDQIRRKQSTTFSIQLKLPLVVIISLFVVGVSMLTSSKLFYDWGMTAGLRTVLAQPEPTPAIIVLPTATPAPVLVTRMGILKGSYVDDVEIPTRYLIEDKDGLLTIVIATANVSLKPHIGKRVLLTGMYEAIRNTLTIRTMRDVEVVR